MKLDLEALSPPKRLAVAYTPRTIRANFALLLLFDSRLGEIVQRTSEPLIGQMRLAWWRDVLAKPAKDRPSGEPLIALLNDVDAPVVHEAMLHILSGWEELIAAEHWEEMILRRHATYRATGLFESYAKLSAAIGDNETIIETGARWALTDCLHYCATQEQYEAVKKWSLEPKKIQLVRELRPLSILARSSAGNICGFSLLWHALTGR
ncbi:MAG: squalene/phytoene synthase family protein [Sphingomonadales bacterium]|nr:squalene/phytoene synthase family protein [Sphingomonadales bacterium]